MIIDPKKPRFVRATGAAAIDLTIGGFQKAWVLNSIYLTLSAVSHASDILAVTVDSAAGSDYDGIILRQAVASALAFNWPTHPSYVYNGLLFMPDDVVHVTFTNTSTRTVGLQVAIQDMH